ncbi:DCC1-like thiol-disulfide oxidoreductase family protein [Algoriphagus pacificus]|uniref:Uncharacterized protein n=1 Tax=Algoriphagus pacificus TaxID=2811234 RepID=A0ABS3CFD3_9BACT|nr:DCC1-like thiol-disulfide oxidoreductase family protein [Algoriphagus pacificus]MBN7815520.1 hypothetical protein [Algoriphagus pacificus]
MKSIIRKLTDNHYTVIAFFFLWGKYILYTKIKGIYFDYNHIENDFFPEIIYHINPFYLDLIVVASIFIQNKKFYLIGILFSLIQIIHPESFGIQNYVVSFYILIWMFINELNPKKPQIFFGRVIVSFIFAGAFIGKLTPGWINSEHPSQFLKHINEFANIPYLFLIGEFAVAISFLLPFGLGILIPTISIFGMILSISFGIFDATGPIFGLILTLVILKFHKKDVLTVYFDQNCGICMKVYRIFNTLNSSYLKLSYLQEADEEVNINKAYIFIASKSNKGNYYGYDTYCEIFSRIPILSLLYPIMKLKIVTKIGQSIYLKVANNRSCKIS